MLCKSRIRNPRAQIAGCVAVCLLAASLVSAAKEEPPLPDGYLLTGVDGEFQQTSPGLYTFMFDKPVKTEKGSIVAGHEIELMPSTTLEYMLRDLGEKPHMGLRLWGTVTVYRGRNFIFPSYYLQIAPAVVPTAAEPNASESIEEAAPGKPMPTINDANDEIKIPEQLIKELKATRRVVDVAPTPSSTEPNVIISPIETGDALIVDRMGFMTVPQKDEPLAFKLDGLGQNVSRISWQILPCQTLQQLEAMRRPSSFKPVRYEIAGVVTKFKGQYYVLPNRVTRVYNYGNFYSQ
jgi:hypothetical protein